MSGPGERRTCRRYCRHQIPHACGLLHRDIQNDLPVNRS